MYFEKSGFMFSLYFLNNITDRHTAILHNFGINATKPMKSAKFRIYVIEGIRTKAFFELSAAIVRHFSNLKNHAANFNSIFRFKIFPSKIKINEKLIAC